MVPLGPDALKLKRVVKEARVKGEAAREAAGAEDAQRVGTRNLVDVGDDQDVAEARGAGVGAEELGKDLLVGGVALKVLKVPSTLGAEATWELELVVEHLVVVLCEAVPALLGQQRLVMAVKGFRGLDNDEEVDFVVERVEANLEPVELRVDHGQVVDFATRAAAARGSGGIHGEAVRGAQLVSFGRVVVGAGREKVLGAAGVQPEEDEGEREEDGEGEENFVGLSTGQTPRDWCKHVVSVRACKRTEKEKRCEKFGECSGQLGAGWTWHDASKRDGRETRVEILLRFACRAR